jgi:pyruvate-formate lyase-activating enzyme
MFEVFICANNITAVENIGYIVRRFGNSRSSAITQKHIDDFFFAYSLMKEKVKNNNDLMKYWNIGIINLVAIKLREIFHLDCAKDILYEYLSSKVRNLGLTNNYSLLNRETQYFKLYKALMENKIPEIGDILKKKWSCFEIQNTLSFGPGKICVCLVRHFFNGNWKDGATLVNMKNNKYEPSELVQEIFLQKQKLLEKINKGIDSDCDGCPFLSFKEWEKLERNLVRIDFVTTTVCNFKCIYCAEDNHDNQKYTYDLNEVIAVLKKENVTRNLKQCSWAGGEITIDKNFDNTIASFSNNFPHIKNTIFTNATILSNALLEQVKNENNVIITSVDAGTAETFKQVHGKNSYCDVLENLSQYAKAGAKNMIVKYILLDENCGIDELKAFVADVKKYELTNCVFQISCNSEVEKIPLNWVEAGVYLFAMLHDCKVRYCFIDEYFHFRMGETLSQDKINEIRQNLREMNLPDIIENADNYSEAVLWGSASQIQWFMNKTHFFNKVKVKKIGHSYPERIGTKVENYVFEHPSIMKNENLPIIIAGVQGVPGMLCEFENLGLDKKLLVKGVIL